MLELNVVAAVVFDADGRVLIAQRLEGTHMPGRWEFPGGKREPGEGRYAALVRELDEEIGIEVLAADPLIRLTHTYPDRRVLLDVWRVTRFLGTPESREGQGLKWVEAGMLDREDILEADAPIIARLRQSE